ncbi:MAG: signal peptidase I [Bacilli bacterium]
MKKIIKQLTPYIVIIIVVVLIRSFVVTPVIVVGDSMKPTLNEGQILILNKLDYRFNEIERYDIVVIKVGKSEIIKRVIGLPGETIEYRNNILYIDGHEETSEYNFDTEDFTLKSICNCDKIPEDKYLVLGDNRQVSSDSRIIGLIDKKDIQGTTQISIWPIKKIK